MYRSISFLVICCAVLGFGCSKSTNLPESVVSSSLNWLSDLKSQIAANDFANAVETIKKIEEKGTIDATQMSEYLTMKARAEMGAGLLDAARATISELERGVEEPAIVHVLRGEVAMKGGDRSTAQTEFAKARSLNSSIAIPRL